MDLQNQSDNAVGIVSAVDSVGASLKNIAANVRNKAKAKKAQKISDAGGYLTLTPFQKSLIQIPDYISKLNVTPQYAKDAPPIPATDGQLAAKAKGLIPIILGVAVVGLAIFFIVKRKS